MSISEVPKYKKRDCATHEFSTDTRIATYFPCETCSKLRSSEDGPWQLQQQLSFQTSEIYRMQDSSKGGKAQV